MPLSKLALVASVVLSALWAPGCAGRQGQAEGQMERATDWFDEHARLDRAVSREPANLGLRRERVRAAHRTGQLSSLERRLREGVAAGGGAPVVYELALTVAIAGEPGSDGEALALLGQVSRLLPQEAEVYYRMGLLRLEQERYEEARPPLERAHDLEPQNASYRVALAAALALCEGREDEVREILAELPRLAPGEAEVARGRAILASLNSPVRHVPSSLRETYEEAVTILSEEGTSAGEAVRLIEEALEVAPESEPFVVLNGLASVRLGQLGRARVAFQRAVELRPGDPLPWLELASLDEETDRLDRSERHLVSALAADPLGFETLAALGRVRYQRRRYEESVDAFRQLLAIDGGQMLTHLWLGRSLRRAGRDDEAERVYLAMLERHPGNFEASLQLGHIYRARRLRERDRERSAELRALARRYYERALEVRPQDPLVQRLLESLEEE